MLFKMVFLQFLYDLPDRQVEGQVNPHLACKWFVGLQPEEAAPDWGRTSSRRFSTASGKRLTRSRTRASSRMARRTRRCAFPRGTRRPLCVSEVLPRWVAEQRRTQEGTACGNGLDRSVNLGAKGRRSPADARLTEIECGTKMRWQQREPLLAS